MILPPQLLATLLPRRASKRPRHFSKRRRLTALLVLAACTPDPEPVVPDDAPAADAFVLAGPGAAKTNFTTEQLALPCAALTGGPEDIEHHNLVGVHDGYLYLPWAPEDGGGGLTIYDFSSPCAPVKVGEAYHDLMRETHTLGIGDVGGRRYLAVDTFIDNDHGGIGFWDVTDPTAPIWAGDLELPDFHYPDAYFRVSLSTFWQGDLLFVSAGFNGIFTVDVSDPASPKLLDQHTEVAFMAGSFHVVGNLGMASSAGLARTLIYDIGNPEDWQTVADFNTLDDEGGPTPYYFAHLSGKYALFARKSEGGGPIVYDISDPALPLRVGMANAPEADGGYVMRHHDVLFQGESNYGAWYDFSNPALPVEMQQIDMSGDFDTLTPIGNVAVASVDEGADLGLATQVFPWNTAVDSTGPTVEFHNPADGQTWVPVSGRIGLSFDEQIEPMSAHAGSFRVWAENGALVSGRYYGQETLVNFVPDEPLSEATTYYVVIPAGGITDVSGNASTAERSFRFSTGETVAERPW